MSALCLKKLRRGSVSVLVSLAFAAACGVPDYKIQNTPDAGPNPSGIGGVPGTGGTSAIVAAGGTTNEVGGSSAEATGGQRNLDPFNCATNEDCSAFSATKVCDTSSSHCVECLPSVTSCGAGLYCGTDKGCHVGCGSDADCGQTTDCDGGKCDARKCNTETHECQGCLSDLDCQPGSVCDKVSGSCVASCGNSTTCPTGWTCCHQGCVNLQTDPANCASCDSPCTVVGGEGQCLNGTCRIGSCKPDYRDCDKRYDTGCEVSRLQDSDNCGECGVVCSRKPDICLNGKCGDPACGKTTGYADCDNDITNGCETNIDSNVSNCGACNVKCSTVNGSATCTAGQCAISCNTGYGDCDKDAKTGCEVDLSTTVANCGTCGASCTNEHGSANCAGGKCAPTCGTGFANCDGNPDNGCETPTTQDLNNCGSCGHICQLPHATAACTNGACTVSLCAYQYIDCNNDASDGCEANPVIDPKNCGSCGNVCNSTNGTATCTGGACGITCNAGFDNCDKNAANGCEVDINASVDHCGSCSTPCQDQPNGTPICDKGVCKPTNCVQPFGDCDQAVQGCETNTNGDPQNCGGCGNRCVTPNAQAVCTLGVCGVGTCNAGYADCNGDPKDGCEVNLNTDTNNCSVCGSKCAPANAVGSCVGGVCKVTSCNQPYQDCNGNSADGCEINVNSNVNNCGACNTVCDSTRGTPSCTYGICGISCAPGYGNCDGDAKNGCESTLSTDASNCGGCQNACAVDNGALGKCVNSVCSVDASKPNGGCNAGFADCNGKFSDGCEARLTSDTANCGSCGTLCNSTNGVASCSNGTCSVVCTPPYGNCDGLASNGCETNESNSLQNCGDCNKPCAPASGTGACAGGQCTIAGCAAGHADCNATPADGCETNLMTDPLHCGLCTTKCVLPNATSTCNSGVCAISKCDSGFADCDGNPANGCEINLSDPAHCGACGTVCSSINGTATCTFNGTTGTCGIICNTGFMDCKSNVPGCETNIKSDVSNCSTCNNACPSGGGGTPVCTNSICGYSTCPTGTAECDNNLATVCETNVKGTDINNCGNCGTTCVVPNGTPKCTAGVCGIQACNAGYMDCDGNVANGCEVNIKTDPNHCNSCTTVCNATNGTAACSNGACTITCNSGYQNCDGSLANGCEVQLGTISNCATCGNVCSATNGTASCTSGSCSIVCNNGYANCDNNVANGCEVNLKTDPSHCNSCSTVCNATHGTATCSNGACGINCSTGYGNCDANLANGCETDTTSNVNYCGGCNSVCSSTNGTPSCSAGTCSISCNAGFDNCDGNAANGCEANLTADAAHCGNCSTACTYTNATGVCSSGACQIGSCTSPYGNCDNNAGNGCEVALNTTSNCNACNVVCTNDHGGQSCTATGCTPSCDAGYLSCDNNANNGCEQSVSSDVNHCGSCTNVCQYANATPICSSSACSMGACNYMYGDCNTNATDGCEKSLSGDVANCGACGNACNATNGVASCASGACSLVCNSGYQNCDGSLTNGCEVNTSTDTNNCGACGTKCTEGCTNGRCNTPCSTYSDCTSTGKTIAVITSAPNGLKPATANTCYEYSPTSNMAGGNCGNFGSNGTMAVNGQTMTCNNQNWTSIPAKNAGGYCFHSYNVWQSNASYVSTW